MHWLLVTLPTAVRINKGLLYEQRVLNSLLDSHVKHLTVPNPKCAGYGNQKAGDIVACFAGIEFHIEVKLNPRAQMGSSQLKYHHATKTITPHSNLIATSDPEYLTAIITAAEQRIPYISSYVEALDQPYVTGFPCVVPNNVRQQLTALKIGQPVNTNTEVGIEQIISHYAANGVDYIQIGQAGLFYLRSNPLNLTIPQFDGTARAEIRIKYGKTTPSGTQRGELAVVSRLLTNEKSPHTLDTVVGVRKVFEDICK